VDKKGEWIKMNGDPSRGS